MPETTTINLQINTDLKSQAEEILDGLGLSFSEAFTLMLQHIRTKQALPFEDVEVKDIESPISQNTLKPEVIAYIKYAENNEDEWLGPFDTIEAYRACMEDYVGDNDDEI